MKEICLTTQDIKDEVESEVKIMKALNHPNIVEFIDSFTEDEYFYIVMKIAGNYNYIYIYIYSWFVLKARE